MSDILDIVANIAGVPTFYAADPAVFWLEAEQQGSYPAVGLYERQGVETADTVGIIHPSIELHVITIGGSMDERLRPSEQVADGRALLSRLLKDLRPYVLRIPSRCGFSRKDSLYTNWAAIELRDPAARCPQ